jgi:RHS repeat-associated protein
VTTLNRRDADPDYPTDRLAWYLTDRQGSVVALVGHASGQILADLRYQGSKPAGGSAFEFAFNAYGPWGYTGRHYHPELQVQYNRARWLDTTNGRWLSEDPIGFAGGDTNLYRYVGNSYPNATDPSGHIISGGTAAIGAGIGAVLGGGVEIGLQLLVHGQVNDWGAVAGAAASGAVAGAITGAFAGALSGDISAAALIGGSLLVGAAAGAAGGAVGNAVTQGVHLATGQQQGGFSWTQLGIATAGGAAGGLVGGGVGSGLTRALVGGAARDSARAVAGTAVSTLVRGAAGGVTGGR